MMLVKLKELITYFCPKSRQGFGLHALFFSSFFFFSSLSYSNEDPALRSINETYQSVLSDYVSVGSKNDLPANMVDYEAIKDDPRLKSLLLLLEDYPEEQLDTRAKKIAFYLNAYNILAIAKVAEHWPLERLKSLGSFFKPVWAHPAGQVCGEQTTLRKLEHEILRKLDEPRVHFAINCASMSCPDLRNEPYYAEKLDEQLEEQTKKFLSQEGKGRRIKGNQVRLSMIFKWFEEDFDSVGGVLAFVSPYLPPGSTWEIAGYLTYDWKVNDHLSGAELMRIKRARGNTWFN